MIARIVSWTAALLIGLAIWCGVLWLVFQLVLWVAESRA